MVFVYFGIYVYLYCCLVFVGFIYGLLLFFGIFYWGSIYKYILVGRLFLSARCLSTLV